MDKREKGIIRRAAKESNNEAAHGLEDALWEDVLVAISKVVKPLNRLL